MSDIARDINDHIIPDGAKNLHEKIPDVRKVFVRGRGSSGNYKNLEDQNIHLLGDMEMRDTSSVVGEDGGSGSAHGSPPRKHGRSSSSDSAASSSPSSSSAFASGSPTNGHGHSRRNPRGLLRRSKYGKLPPTFESEEDEYVTSSPFREKADEEDDDIGEEQNPESGSAVEVNVRNPENTSPDGRSSGNNSGNASGNDELV